MLARAVWLLRLSGSAVRAVGRTAVSAGGVGPAGSSAVRSLSGTATAQMMAMMGRMAGRATPLQPPLQPLVPRPAPVLVAVRTLKTARRQRRRDYRKKSTYKLKTRKALAARFQPLGNGGLKYRHSGRVHNASTKTSATRRRLRRPAYLKGKMLIKYRKALHGKKYR